MTNYILSVSSASTHLKDIVSTFDRNDYTLERAFEIASEDVYLIGNEAVRAIDEYVEFHSTESLLTLVGELNRNHYINSDDFTSETIANLAFYLITDSVFQYVENLSLNNNSEIVEVLDRIIDNHYNEEVATFNGLEAEINDTGERVGESIE